jgi:hypothetical protein
VTERVFPFFHLKIVLSRKLFSDRSFFLFIVAYYIQFCNDGILLYVDYIWLV